MSKVQLLAHTSNSIAHNILEQAQNSRTLHQIINEPLYQTFRTEKVRYQLSGEYKDMRPVMEYLAKKIGTDPSPAFFLFLLDHGIRAVKWIHWKGSNKRSYKGKNFAYAMIYPDGKTITKQPIRKGKDYYTTTLNNTIGRPFGYDLLPNDGNGKQCILVEGETDCLAVNWHLHKYGIHAVTYGGTSANVKQCSTHFYIIQNSRSFTYKILPDNDAPGKRAAEQIQEKTRAQVISLEAITAEKDVCDYLQNGGSFAKILDAIGVMPDTVERYLSEHQEYILERIAHSRSVALEAPTGSGKTTMVQYLLQNLDKTGCSRIILAVPLQSIAGQQAIEIPGNFPTIMQGSDIVEIEEAGRAILTICTFDSIYKIQHLVKNALLIVDEAHLLQDAYRYRSKALNRIYDYLEDAKKVLLLSGTMPPKLAGLTADRHLKFTRKINPSINTRIRIYSRGTAPAIGRTHEGKGTTVIVCNSLKLLLSFQHDLQKRGKTSTIISSKSRKYKEDNPFYTSIRDTGQLPEPVDYILTTSLMETGVNFRFPVSEFVVINPDDIRALIQAISRARMDDAINSDVSLTIYKKASDTAHAERISKDLQSYKTAVAEITETEEAERLLNEANRKCLAMNQDVQEWPQEKLYRRQREDAVFRCIEYDATAGHFYVSTLAALYEGYLQSLEFMTLPVMIRKLKEALPGMELQQVEIIGLDNKGLAAPVKKKIKEQEDAALDLMEDALPVFADVVCHTTTDKELQAEIRNKYGTMKTMSDDGLQMYSEYQEAFDNGAGTKHLKRYFRIKELATVMQSHETTGHSVIIQLIRQHRTPKQYTLLHNRLVMLYDRKCKNPLSKQRTEDARLIKESIANKYGKNRYSKPIPKSELQELVYKITGDRSPQRAMTRIRELYFIQEESRTLITLQRAVTATAIVQEYFPDFFQKKKELKTAANC